jgi:hypothetical protein
LGDWKIGIAAVCCGGEGERILLPGISPDAARRLGQGLRRYEFTSVVALAVPAQKAATTRSRDAGNLNAPEI